MWVLADWNVGQWIIDALRWFLLWLSDMLAAKLEAVLDVLPKFPQLDWSWMPGIVGYVNAWVPLRVFTVCCAIYLVWWLVWSVVRIVLKIIWSG